MSASHIHLGAAAIPIWPQGQEIAPRGDPAIVATVFGDTDQYHPRLIAKVLELESHARTRKRYFRGACGTKVHHLDRWNNSEADLLNARACTLFRKVLNADAAHIDICWANVYRTGDYCIPHSHVRTVASIVYCLDPGDEDPEDPLSGAFTFVDPRIKSCCQESQHCMTTPFVPGMTPGTMLMFPSQLVHCVNPYTGRRPRITLSWNIHMFEVAGVVRVEECEGKAQI